MTSGGYGYRVKNKDGEMIFFSYEHDSPEYTFQEESKPSSHLWIWSIEPSGQLLFCKEKPQFLEETKALSNEKCITHHKPLVEDFKIE